MPSLASASLDTRERRVLERLLLLLQAEFGGDLVAVWLYGSRARGEPVRRDSDVDLLVVTRGGRARDLGTVIRLITRAADLEDVDPGLFAAHVWDPELLDERRRIDSFFVRELERDKIVLYESE